MWALIDCVYVSVYLGLQDFFAECVVYMCSKPALLHMWGHIQILKV